MLCVALLQNQISLWPVETSVQSCACSTLNFTSSQICFKLRYSFSRWQWHRQERFQQYWLQELSGDNPHVHQNESADCDILESGNSIQPCKSTNARNHNHKDKSEKHSVSQNEQDSGGHMPHNAISKNKSQSKAKQQTLKHTYTR